ncbi:UNVERIFIED_CONTAM: hypothetical protein GTU68_016908 [Idotea baltica]|nr:hypothetical protein [Idotea baltica]
MSKKASTTILEEPSKADYKNGIYIKGARANNLKNVDLVIPKNKLVVVTGVSGSGKSSITMDTLFAEGQRRYVESLSSYARQFLMRMKKPEVDYIKGIWTAQQMANRTKGEVRPMPVYSAVHLTGTLRFTLRLLLRARVWVGPSPTYFRQTSKETLR